MSSRWLLLGLAGLCANVAGYEIANEVQLAEVGVAQPELHQGMREGRPVAVRRMLASYLSISAALLFTLVMLQRFRFLQRNEEKISEELAANREDPCKKAVHGSKRLTQLLCIAALSPQHQSAPSNITYLPWSSRFYLGMGSLTLDLAVLSSQHEPLCGWVK
ncbi:hypothetical protein Efla_003012 [Eimeria flavescens]